MRVFVTGTGRCGTVTCSKAFSHAENFTVGHETKAGKLDDYEYPDNHIEVSAQLIVGIPHLRKKYPAARWVWVVRERQACARSIAKLRNERGLIAQQFTGIFCQSPNGNETEAAYFTYDRLMELCSALLPSESTLIIPLDEAGQCWRYVWDALGCEGDYSKSVNEWSYKYNAST